MDKELNLDGFYHFIMSRLTKESREYIENNKVLSPYFVPKFENEPSKQEVWSAAVDFCNEKENVKISSLMNDLSWIFYNAEFTGNPKRAKEIKDKYFKMSIGN